MLTTIGDALRCLRAAGFAGAVCAGGAVRDTLLDRTIKDIDIFIQPTGLSKDALLEALKKAFGIVENPDDMFFSSSQIRVVISEEVEQYLGSLRDVARVVEVYKEGVQYPFQIVELDRQMDLGEIIRRVDFGICQAGVELVDDEPLVRVTAQFSQDSVDKVFRISDAVVDKADYERSLNRYVRLSKKYRGWRLDTRGRVFA